MRDVLAELDEWKQAAGCEAGLRREFAGLAKLYREQRDSLYEALQTADDTLSMIQGAAVKGVPHGMDLNSVRAIIAAALRARDVLLPNGDRQ